MFTSPQLSTATFNANNPQRYFGKYKTHAHLRISSMYPTKLAGRSSAFFFVGPLASASASGFVLLADLVMCTAPPAVPESVTTPSLGVFKRSFGHLAFYNLVLICIKQFSFFYTTFLIHKLNNYTPVTETCNKAYLCEYHLKYIQYIAPKR